jgi:hypothetical protein
MKVETDIMKVDTDIMKVDTDIMKVDTDIMKVETDIMGRIAARLAGQAVILVIIYVETIKTDVIDFIDNIIIVCFTTH